MCRRSKWLVDSEDTKYQACVSVIGQSYLVISEDSKAGDVLPLKGGRQGHVVLQWYNLNFAQNYTNW